MCINCRAERDGSCSKAKYKATACSKMPGFSESSFRMLHIPAATLCGCQRAEPVQWAASEQVRTLAPELAAQVSTAVQTHSGTVLLPKMLTDVAAKSERDKYARELTAEAWSGRLYEAMRAVSRRFRRWQWSRGRQHVSSASRLSSKGFSSLPPRRTEASRGAKTLMATLDRGIVGTSMPSFRLLPKKDIEAVVDYVMVLAQRGELEYQLGKAKRKHLKNWIRRLFLKLWTLLGIAGRSGSVTDSAADSAAGTDSPMSELRWGVKRFSPKAATNVMVTTVGDTRRTTSARIPGGFSTRAADLTSGMLHGGQEPIDIYRRIMNGINGTPMPGFKSALESEPETIWNLVSYVLSVSNRRREGTAIPAGLMKPYNEPVA
jgi:hypothetical protein